MLYNYGVVLFTIVLNVLIWFCLFHFLCYFYDLCICIETSGLLHVRNFLELLMFLYNCWCSTCFVVLLLYKNCSIYCITHHFFFFSIVSSALAVVV